MRALILAAGAALALSACGGNDANEADANNTLAVENLEVDNVVLNDPMANGMDANSMGTMNGVDANTANAMEQDLTTNSPDTNLANGM